MAIAPQLASVELKPPLELLADEYQRGSNKHFIVQIIYGKLYKGDGEKLKECMSACGFTVMIDEFKQFSQTLKTLKAKIQGQRETKRAGILLAVLCSGRKDSKEEGGKSAGKLFSDDGEVFTFVNVWDIFIKMEQLNRLPKIFLFQNHLPPTRFQFDGYVKPKRLYDVAAPGADLFLISRTVTAANSDSFITCFCDLIRQHGKEVDLFELATFATNYDRPLIVSTLTAKFYFEKAAHRHINYRILKGLNEIQTSIKQQLQISE